MIDDEELREIFRTESANHIQRMEDGLLRLEQDPQDEETLREVFRSAHTLKGSAALMEVEDVRLVAHRFEDVLGAARDGDLTVTPTIVDGLCGQIDAIRALVAATLSGEPSGVDVEAVLDALSDDRLTVTASTEGATAPSPAVDPRPEAEPPSTPAPAGRFQIDTVRIDPSRLDDLIRQSGELTVARLRIDRRVARVDGILTTCEELGRGLRTRREDNGGHAVKADDINAALSELRNLLTEDSMRLHGVGQELDVGIREMRLLPFSSVFQVLPRAVRDIARQQGKNVQLEVVGEDLRADKLILEELKDPLLHAIRNAVDHGIEPPEERAAAGKPEQGVISLTARQEGPTIVVEVGDDGRGLSPERIKATAIERGVVAPESVEQMTDEQVFALIFEPGFSTSSVITDVSGRGVGMDVVRTTVEGLKGRVEVESSPGKGATIRLRLPLSVATARILVVRVGSHKYAIPTEHVASVRPAAGTPVHSVEGRQAILDGDEPLFVVDPAPFLQVDRSGAADGHVSADSAYVVVETGSPPVGIFVDELIEEQDAIVKPPPRATRHARLVAGATILDTGTVCVVLNCQELVRLSRGVTQARPRAHEADDPEPTILVVEDSLTTRTQETRILEGAGYRVVTAVDGLDGLEKLSTESIDAVVSDVEMPRLDGLAMTEQIRAQPEFSDLPIILVTSLASEADRKRGADAGANAYITKSGFDQGMLLDTLRRLV